MGIFTGKFLAGEKIDRRSSIPSLLPTVPFLVADYYMSKTCLGNVCYWDWHCLI